MKSKTNSIALRGNWVGRSAAFVLRALQIIETADTFDAGSDYGGDIATPPGFPAIAAMSTLGQFSWVAAAVTKISSDLSMVPLRVKRGSGTDAELLDEHPLLDLLAQPGSRTNGVTFRRQAWVDKILEGNSYTLVLSGLEPALRRLHPARVSILAEADGQPRAYAYDEQDRVTHYAWDTTLHVRGPSWEDDPKSLYGQGIIRALARDLQADWRAQNANAAAAGRGRPELIISPKEENDSWPEKLTKAIRSKLEQLMSEAHGGALVLGRALDVEKLSWTPKDAEYVRQRELVRDTIMAVVGATPVTLGLQSANFATAQQEQKIYWENRVADAALFDAEFTRLAELLGQPGDKLVHDFSGIAALQESRTDRLSRVQVHVGLGLPTKDAYAYEGFEDAPVPEEASSTAGSLSGIQIQSALEIVGSVAAGKVPRETGIGMLVSFFNLLPEQAEAIMGPVGVTFSTADSSESRSDRLDRVRTHILLGMDPADAYAFEGFTDAPAIEDIDEPIEEPAAAK